MMAMKKAFASVLLILLCIGLPLLAQTAAVATINDAIVHNTHAQGQGGAIACVNNYLSCQVMKNAVYADNPTAEGLHNQEGWVVDSPSGTTAGSPVSFTTNSFYIPTSPGSGLPGGNAILSARWVGAKLTMGEYANGTRGCTDTSTGVVVNGADGTEGTLTLTFASGACPNLSAGDYAIMTKDEVPANGAALPPTSASVSGGARSLTTPLPRSTAQFHTI